MLYYSQRNPAWANHALGWGPNDGTIGAYGCYETDFAMILTDSGHAINPADLDDQLTQRQLFVRESTGTYDLLVDNTLDLLYPGEYSTTSTGGFDGAGIAQAVPSPNIYAVLFISTAAVSSHFVIAASANGAYIIDPWTGTIGSLGGYGGPGAIHKTVFVTHNQPPPPPPPPAPPAGNPLPLPTPPIYMVISFVTGTDDHPPDQVTTLADAEKQADDWLDAHTGGHIELWDGGGHILYTNGEA